MSCGCCDNPISPDPVMEDRETYIQIVWYDDKCYLDADFLAPDGLDHSWSNRWIPIRFCPMCGERLVDE